MTSYNGAGPALVIIRKNKSPAPTLFRLMAAAANARSVEVVELMDDRAVEHYADMVRDAPPPVVVDYANKTFARAPLERLAREVVSRGGRYLGDPRQVQRWGDKTRLHVALVERGVPVPATTFRNARQDAALSAEELRILGPRIVLKPSRGSKAEGVDLDFSATAQNISREVARYRAGVLLQEFVEAARRDGRTAWLRVYACFDEIYPCFWDPVTHETTRIGSESADLPIAEITRLVRLIGDVTGYGWFSTEIALCPSESGLRPVVIDYANHKPFYGTQSEVGARGLPDSLASDVAELIARRCAVSTIAAGEE